MIRLVLLCLPWLGACTPQEAPVPPEQPNEPPAPLSAAVLFEGGRLIVGDGNTIENASFLVEDGRFTQVGVAGTLDTPPGAARIDLTGKTVMPALIDAHCHLG